MHSPKLISLPDILKEHLNKIYIDLIFKEFTCDLEQGFIDVNSIENEKVLIKTLKYIVNNGTVTTRAAAFVNSMIQILNKGEELPELE